MTLLKDIISAPIMRPPRILIHGVPGVGKTTFGAGCPAPIFIQTEEGADLLGVDRFPLSETYADVTAQLDTLLNEKHSYKTVVIDTLDWLEPLISAAVCQKGGKPDLSSFGYGEGYKKATLEWRSLLKKLGRLRDEKNMMLVYLAHTQISTFHDPTSESYDRYEPKLHKQIRHLMVEHSDLLGFATYQLRIDKTDTGFGGKKIRAKGSGERVLYTQEQPSWTAKSRYNIPQSLGFNWGELELALNNKERTND